MMIMIVLFFTIYPCTEPLFNIKLTQNGLHTNNMLNINVAIIDLYW